MIANLLLAFFLNTTAADPGAFLGVQLTDVPDAVAEHLEIKGGAMINDVIAGSPADKAGLKRKDIVTSIDGKAIQDPASLQETIRSHKAGDKVALELLRGDKNLKLDVELGERAAPPAEKKEEEKGEKAPELKKPQPGFLGLRFGPIPAPLAEHLNLKEGSGALVEDVFKDSPAAKAGIFKNDVLLTLAGKEILSLQEAHDAIRDRKEGDEVPIEVIHKGNHAKVTVTLGSRPKDIPFEPFDRIRPFRKLQPMPGFKDRSSFRGKLFWKNPNGEEKVFVLPEISEWEDLARTFGDRFHEQFKGLPEDIEKRLHGLLDKYKNDLEKFNQEEVNDEEILERQDQVSIARLVEGDADITVRDAGGQRTITVKQGAEVLATDMPYEKLDTLPRDIQEKVRKVVEKLPGAEKPASRRFLNPLRSSEKSIKI